MGEEQWGGDGLGPEDMQIPEIKLIQNVGGALARAAGATPGDFYCSLTDEITKGDEGFEMVIVAMQKSRTYWGREEIEDEPPICACLDVKSGISQSGEECAKCEHRDDAPWLLSATERRSKCLINYNVLGINLNSDMPVLVRTSGISAQAAKELYTQLSLNRQLAGGWYKAKTLVTSVPKKSSAGDAFAIKFGRLELMPVESQKEFEVRAHAMLGTPISLPEGREEEAGTETEVKVPAQEVKKSKAPTDEQPPVEEKPVDLEF